MQSVKSERSSSRYVYRRRQKIDLGDKRNKKMNSKIKVHPQNSKLISVRFRKLFIKIVGFYNGIINLFVLFWNDLPRVLHTFRDIFTWGCKEIVCNFWEVVFAANEKNSQIKLLSWGWLEQAYAFAVLSSLQK